MVKEFVGIGMQENIAKYPVDIWFGCTMPRIIRQAEGDWIILVECYVHELMEGGRL